MGADLKASLGETVGGIVESKLGESKKRRSLYGALKDGRKTGVRVIAELKLSSPSEGKLKDADGSKIGEIVRSFEDAGASAVSVLVEPRRFGGSIDHLREARKATDLPIIAKGFIFNPVHIAECASAGADAFLLMVKVVESLGEDMDDLIGLGKLLGMEAMVEANDPEEIKRALSSGAAIIEVNNRDIYGDLGTDLKRASIGSGLPDDVVLVSASGIEAPDQLMEAFRISGSRADAILAGTGIMRSDDIEAKVRELSSAGKEAVR